MVGKGVRGQQRWKRQSNEEPVIKGGRGQQRRMTAGKRKVGNGKTILAKGERFIEKVCLTPARLRYEP